MSTHKQRGTTTSPVVIENEDHYAVVKYDHGTPTVLGGFTWLKGLVGPTYVGSKAKAKVLAEEKAKLGYCPSL